MDSVTLEVTLIVVLILANGVFAMSEISIVSARKARLASRAAAGHDGARVALDIANSPNEFLSTVQVGITLVGILAGAFGGATVAERLAPALATVPALARFSEGLALAMVVAAITYLSLVVGELVPKRLALGHAERIAAAVAKPMQMLSRATGPLVRVLTVSTDAVFRLVRARPSPEPAVTEDEVRILIDQGTVAGVFEPAEKEIVKRALRLGDKRVLALMTQRVDIVWLDIEDSTDAIVERISMSGYSRFPVGDGSLDNVLGMVRAKDLIAQLAKGTIDLRAALRQPHFVPETARVLKVLELFKGAHTHVALVVDEHGIVQGMVTHHDVLEAVVGDLALEPRSEDRSAVQREDGSWLIDGALDLHEFKELLRVKHLPGEERDDFHTIAGFVMSQLGRVPFPGEHFETSGLRFEIVDMDGRRVDKLLVSSVADRSS